jgi:hypothetical protein
LQAIVWVTAAMVIPLEGAQVRKKLIEFGWDEPGTAFMRQHWAEMKQTPFDGCVFHVNFVNTNGSEGNFTWACWGQRAFTAAELNPALNDLKAVRGRGFTHNFLRFNVTPGKVDWFDDFGPILQNARLAGWLAREGKCAGILFDIEHYEGAPFRYREQRDAGTKSWELYAHQARLRGREVMQAFQQDFPAVKIFLTFGYCLPWKQSDAGKRSLADIQYGLLAPFLDGMVEAANKPKQIIDGCESAYSFRDTARFATQYKVMSEGLLPIVRDPERYHKAVSLGFGVWMDNDWRKVGWKADQPGSNYYTPQALEASLRKALEVADEYVWVYSETPRWWSDQGKPVQLPEVYVEAVRGARRGGGNQ